MAKSTVICGVGAGLPAIGSISNLALIVLACGIFYCAPTQVFGQAAASEGTAETESPLGQSTQAEVEAAFVEAFINAGVPTDIVENDQNFKDQVEDAAAGAVSNPNNIARTTAFFIIRRTGITKFTVSVYPRGDEAARKHESGHRAIDREAALKQRDIDNTLEVQEIRGVESSAHDFYHTLVDGQTWRDGTPSESAYRAHGRNAARETRRLQD